VLAESAIAGRLARAVCVFVAGAGIVGCNTMPAALDRAPLLAMAPTSTSGPIEALPTPESRTWPDPRRDVMNQRARGFGLVNAPEATRYLNALYSRIKAAAGVPDWQGEVHLLAQSSLDAYATAAGNIYVGLPWLASAQSEDELVALLAHEFGHVYLHYQSLEGAIESSDTAAGFLAIGVAVARKTAQAAGWTEVDTLAASYAVGRSLVTALYGQTQESAADRLALHVTHKLGYSYEHGPKAFLERLAGWEAHNEAREKARQEAIKKAVQTVRPAALESQAPQKNKLVISPFKDIGPSLEAGMNDAASQLRKTMAKVTSSHPDTLQRQDALAQLAEQTPELIAERDPVTAPLNGVLTEQRTAQILAHYDLAYKALESPNSPEALGWAKQAASGWTGTHAVPLFALYTVAKAQRAVARSVPRDPGELLELNIESERDRAWITYTERSTRLREAGRRDAAKRTLERGLVHFAEAEEAMPFAVRFYGETEGWEKAKLTAQVCGQRFPKAAGRCNGAARSPAEMADRQQKEKQKADQLIKKVFKKP
jgi:Zn-dependent protease with chaperone function